MPFKNKYLLFSFLLIMPVTATYSQNAWMMRDSVNGPHRSASVGFSLPNGQGYIGTGWDGDSYKRSFFSYDPQQDDWDQETSLGGLTGQGLGRSAAFCFTIGVDAYIGTGQGANPFFKDFWKYDPYSKVWTQLANFGGTARRSAVGFAIGGKGYAGTGYDDSFQFKNDFWAYDPLNNSWSEILPFPGSPRDQAVAFVIDTLAFVGLGDDGTFTRDFWKYDPSNDNWTQIADFAGTPRYGAAAFSIDTAGFVCTGYDSTFHFKSDIWEYHPINDAWVERAPLPGPPRSHAVAFSINGVGYLGLGYRGILMDDFWAYFPTVGIQQHQPQQLSATVFPNPVSTYATFVLPVDNPPPSAVLICSTDGKLISRSGEISYKISEKNKLYITLDVSHFADGVYIARFPGIELSPLKFIVMK